MLKREWSLRSEFGGVPGNLDRRAGRAATACAASTNASHVFGRNGNALARARIDDRPHRGGGGVPAGGAEAAENRLPRRLLVDMKALRIELDEDPGAENRRQRPFGQATGDEHIQVVQRHVPKTHPHLAWARLGLGPLAQLQRRRPLEADEFQRTHVPKSIGW